MKTLKPLSTMPVPSSPLRRVVIERKTAVSLNRREVLEGEMGEMIRVGRGASLVKKWLFDVPEGKEVTVTLEVAVERGASFEGEIAVQGAGVLRVRRILRVLGSKARATWLMRGSALDKARIFEDSWVFIRGEGVQADVRTRLVLEDESSFVGRHMVEAGARTLVGRLGSQLDVLRLSPLTRATVIPEVGLVPESLAVSHGGRVAGLEEVQAEYLQGRGIEGVVVNDLLKEAFLYGG